MDEQELRERIKSRYWRLNNLYWIKDKHGKRVKFRFNSFQEHLFRNLWYFNLILKARQLGITTFFCIVYLDAILFSPNKNAGIIAHTEKDAKKIFKDKVKFAFDNLPKTLREELEIKTDSTEELSFRNGSSIFVSVSTRSGTVQYLHISEFGWTCLKYPDKAEEIVTGAINSVEQGNYVSIESTAHTREGYFYKFIKEAQKNQKLEKKLSLLDFRLFFFPWFMNKDYTLNGTKVLPQSLLDYFNELELKEGIKLEEGQKQWYAAKFVILDDKMFSEYPSTIEEAFQAAIEGAYYSKQLLKTIQEKRITNVPWNDHIQVDTWWDLGMNDTNTILFTQKVGKEIRFIDEYANSGEGLAHYVKILQEKPYIYGTHYLPWDIQIRDLSTGASRLSKLRDLGMRNTYPSSDEQDVPRLSISEGIELVRGLFNRFWFDEQKCGRLINAITNYRKEWNDKLGVFQDHPLHDENSHWVDPLRILGFVYGTEVLSTPEERKGPMSLEEKYGIFPHVI